MKERLISEFETEAKKHGLESPKDAIVIDVVKLSLGMGVGLVVRVHGRIAIRCDACPSFRNRKWILLNTSHYRM